MKNTLALIRHPKSHLHVQPFPRPNLESFDAPLRIQMAERYLEEKGLVDRVIQEKAPRASAEDILRVHTPYLFESVRLLSEFGSGNLGEAAYASPDLQRNALVSAGGAIRAAEKVTKKETTHSFSLMRPPGHHASRSTAAGLCYFNNVAIAVRKIMMGDDMTRVTILDFDDHFGNGTADIFYEDPSVQYISIHEYDYENFGVGHYEELGYGDAMGTNVNIPLLDGASNTVYQEAMERIVVPTISSFKPDMIAISAGFDSHYTDPVGNMNVDSSLFWFIGNSIKNLVETLGNIGSFSVMEGGYNPMMTGPSIFAYLSGLLGDECPVLEDQMERQPVKTLDDSNSGIIDQVIDTVSRFW
ncbi:MAG: histone deacetylase family protein [Candidatus Thorarchaeota archaeon]|jgi:acetoin utilization deacetylase AcuC-like enzyme